LDNEGKNYWADIKTQTLCLWTLSELGVDSALLTATKPEEIEHMPSIILNCDSDFWIEAGIYSNHREKEDAKMIEDRGSRIEDRFTRDCAILYP
jgi:hypothetical protein